MEGINLSTITIDRISWPALENMDIEGDMLRLDKIHPFVSGNKWFKLRYYLEEAKQQNKKRILTYGGAWSNHILATAAACQLHGIACTGIIRGERPSVLSKILQQAGELGMEFVFLSREDYSCGRIPDELKTEDNYFISPGGYGSLGARGASTILEYCHTEKYTHICCAVGTGTMLAGLAEVARASLQVIGISVLKNNFQLEEEVKKIIPQHQHPNYRIIHDYHLGGYARNSEQLIHFMNGFFRETGIPTDFVYTGKLCFGVMNMVEKKIFPSRSRILLIHSGGLSGNQSLKKGLLIF